MSAEDLVRMSAICMDASVPSEITILSKIASKCTCSCFKFSVSGIRHTRLSVGEEVCTWSVLRALSTRGVVVLAMCANIALRMAETLAMFAAAISNYEFRV